MIKRVKEFSETALITQNREFLENFESDITRGVSKLTILSVINRAGPNGNYGYQILKDLNELTGGILVIEDGTLYPILNRLQRDGLITSNKKEITGRSRTYYTMTDDGKKVFNLMQGFYTKLTESIASLFDISVTLKEQYIYCPNCRNRIDLKENPSFCEMCGLNIEDLKRRSLHE
jgi:DNA-binding PadR family transcriptional regulator